ncbi:MAG TPA: HEPN domain-containing protein [Saprospiraceae bacterium]|nr:HEPN domain-containing protein [Saprospiraceae bacterium]HMP22896.1 HEPN domain-containing protein [Saprospiraceae bacterium]
MSYSKEDLANYRIERAKESLEEASILSESNHWNTVANRLYYACFYITSAYLVKNNMEASTHNGIKSKFNNELIKKDIIEKKYGQLYNKLFNLRQDADYRDYKDVSEEKIKPMIQEVEALIKLMEDLTRES